MKTMMVGTIILCAAASPSYAAVYKCMVNGQATFSSVPCANPSERETGRMDNKPALSIGAKKSYGNSSSASSAGTSKGKQRLPIDEAPTQQLIGECLDYFRPMLRDPRGAYADRGQLQMVKNLDRPDVPEWKELVLDARATNGFGGYVSQTFHCILDASGNVDQERSEVYKALITLGVKPE